MDMDSWNWEQYKKRVIPTLVFGPVIAIGWLLDATGAWQWLGDMGLAVPAIVTIVATIAVVEFALYTWWERRRSTQ